MRKPTDLTGHRFGRLTVIAEAERGHRNKRMWACQCDCGKRTIVRMDRLRGGTTSSCGCYKDELSVERNIKHGKSHNRLYAVWSNMRERCYNSKKRIFKDYGGRGISVCDEWNKSFQAFYDYVTQLPHYNEKGYSLDRINNNGNYEPGNVRWTTQKEQNYNTRIPVSNTSGHKGVSYNKRAKKWRAYVAADNHQIHLGFYDTYEEAVMAREKGELEYYGRHTQ